MNHGIAAGGTANLQLGAGMGDYIEKYIFPGGELLHVSHVLRDLADAGLEMVDTENLRPHYARTLWAWPTCSNMPTEAILSKGSASSRSR